MDHYKVLGLHKTASKEEIKTAFKKLAFQFHPDKHSQSPKSVRDTATLRFKQVSEAYEVLMDDRKRADYNIRFRSGAAGYGGGGGGGGYYSSYGYGYGRSGSGYESSRYKNSTTSSFSGGGFASKFEIVMRILTARASLLNLGFAAAILGSIVVINTSGESLWNMQNSGHFDRRVFYIDEAEVALLGFAFPKIIVAASIDDRGVFWRQLLARDFSQQKEMKRGFEGAIAGVSLKLQNSSSHGTINEHNSCAFAYSFKPSRKSFEEAMKSIEKAKAYREENTNERP
ncbi:unnamed protein product [Lupinus luteus]|uniref:J domain-containing protein n=1 Tax=Lupinus luteus TaxID=3873 RepID=A0AAV1VQD9_LUPLU